jgi:hypothetical protein
MNTLIIVASTAAALLLGACSQSPSEKLADRVENTADARADAMENAADSLDKRADQVRQTGEQRAEGIDAADRDNRISGMTQEERDAIVANEAAAVR